MPERLECEVLQKERYITTLTFTFYWSIHAMISLDGYLHLFACFLVSDLVISLSGIWRLRYIIILMFQLYTLVANFQKKTKGNFNCICGQFLTSASRVSEILRLDRVNVTEHWTTAVMLERLFFFLGDIHHTKLGGADSFSDQLNCKWTVFLLSLFALISTTRIYVSDPIGCFCPANFPPSQVDYTTKASAVFRLYGTHR